MLFRSKSQEFRCLGRQLGESSPGPEMLPRTRDVDVTPDQRCSDSPKLLFMSGHFPFGSFPCTRSDGGGYYSKNIISYMSDSHIRVAYQFDLKGYARAKYAEQHRGSTPPADFDSQVHPLAGLSKRSPRTSPTSSQWFNPESRQALPALVTAGTRLSLKPDLNPYPYFSLIPTHPLAAPPRTSLYAQALHVGESQGEAPTL